MKRLAWKAIATGASILAAIGTRKTISALWPGSAEPPVNPADRRIGWGQAAAWAVVSGIGAGLARTISRRVAAGGWEKVVGETPPGVPTTSTAA